MPAVNEDPAAPVIAIDKEFSTTITPRQVTLRDRVTVATLVPFSSADHVPRSLLSYLSDQLNKEIEKGDTYPMIDPIPFSQFGPYWFCYFGAVMLLGDIKSVQETQTMDRTGTDWTKICLGSFNIRPNYPGRSSHICNGMFLVTDAARNKGVGRLMGEGYLEWAPKLGYTYSVFNLVYESNVASCRIWDALGFKRIGRIPDSGKLRSCPEKLVDAIIYGRSLGTDSEDFVTQDRFDKIRYYLKHSKYPRGADRAEKSRLRSAATHYRLIDGKNGEFEKLMLKDKEVVSDPQQQYTIAQHVHLKQHAGINKTTAAIAVNYHWVRIKETVGRVIRECPKCKGIMRPLAATNEHHSDDILISRKDDENLSPPDTIDTDQLMKDNAMDSSPNHDHSDNPFTSSTTTVQGSVDSINDYATMPLDPQIIEIHEHLPRFQHHDPTIPVPYAHEPHGLSSSNFTNFNVDDRNHASDDYQMMVDDSDAETGAALRRETLGIVNSQATDAQQGHEILAKYVSARSEDGLDLL